MKIIFNPKQNI